MPAYWEILDYNERKSRGNKRLKTPKISAAKL